MSNNATATVTTQQVRLVFADDGQFHTVMVAVPADRLQAYDRLVDMIREEPSVTRSLYVDMRRLVSASLVEEENP